MKYSIICFLFGHKWLAEDYTGYPPGSTRFKIRPMDWCNRCGLSKKEAGINYI